MISDTNFSRPHGFKLEQSILQNRDLFSRFRQQWESELSHEGRFANTGPASIYWRNSPPYGYTISGGINRSENLDTQAQWAAQIMRANHTIYLDFGRSQMAALDELRSARRHELQREHGTEITDPESVTSFMSLQPSYRTYIYYHGDELRITICPMFLASVGALEAINTVVDRSPNNRLLYTDEEIEEFNKSFTVRLQTLLSS